ncbi:MAG: ParB/RepB/Spo0J family partition protein [Firmicutes bacterium]|nr:ParB/RepB/Spo0J family partition protein [Bacillota bacterium]
MAKKLGKGLNAVITTTFTESASENEEVVQLAVDEIRPNPYQPRHDFDPESLKELAASIAEHGILQPILVRPSAVGFELVAGERRWRAAQLAGHATLPAVVRALDERSMMELALIENLQRADLNPIEEAEAYQRLIHEFSLREEEVAQRVGKSRPYIANTLRLLRLPTQTQQAVRSGHLSAGHARALVGLPEEQIKRLTERILAEGLNVRETEALVREVQEPARSAAGNQRAHLREDEERHWREMAKSLQEMLGLPVRLRSSSRRPALEIDLSPQESSTVLYHFLDRVAQLHVSRETDRE